MRFLKYIVGALLVSSVAANYCSGRGGCNCDCAWTSQFPCSRATDDGSCCFSCCCGGSSGGSTGGGSSPTSAPHGDAGNSYCPAAGDLVVAYGNANLHDGGWTVNGGGGGVATKASFNLLGGSVEYDIDVSNVRTGVNANIYTISPGGIGGGFDQSHYCDGAATGSKWCVEVDWIESNGNCGGATTLHTVEGPGNNGCTAWGCKQEYHYNGRNSFHMRIEYGQDGKWTTYRDGQQIGPYNLNPSPSGNDWGSLAGAYRNQGAVVYSSMWTGWVPVGDCGTYGDLGASSFTIKNLKITGNVVQGPKPRTCSTH